MNNCVLSIGGGHRERMALCRRYGGGERRRAAIGLLIVNVIVRYAAVRQLGQLLVQGLSREGDVTPAGPVENSSVVGLGSGTPSVIRSNCSYCRLPDTMSTRLVIHN